MVLSAGDKRTHGLEHNVRLASIAAPLPRLYCRVDVNESFTDEDQECTHGKRPIGYYVLLSE